MNLLSRYLTTSNVLSWPVILLISFFTVTANLSDSSLNGTTFVVERVFLVLLGQVIFFLGVLLCNWLFIRRVTESFRWVVLLAVIVVCAVIRGVVYAVIALALEISQALYLWPRILSSITTLVVLLLIITVTYGLVAESARQRRQLKSIHIRIAGLKREQLQQQEINSVLLENTLTRLKESLAPDLLDTPEKTLSALRSSIDEVIRPITLTMSHQAEILDRGLTVRAYRVKWRKLIRRMLEARSINPLAGVMIFAMWIALPLTRVFPFIETIGFLTLLATGMWLLTTVLRFLVLRYLPKAQHWLAPVILILSASFGVYVASFFMPEWIVGFYELGLFAAYVLSGFLAIALRLAYLKSKEMAVTLSDANADLDWTLARTNELRLFNDRVISSSLHGKAQAALSAAALRLQQALRDGSNVEHSAELARQEAARVLLVVNNIDPVVQPLRDSLQELAELWRGVCEIEWDKSDPVYVHIDSDPICSRLSGEIIVELCSNAIKHGKAQKIWVAVSFVGDRIASVIVKNDGEGLKPEASGFGSQLIEQSCLNREQFEVEGLTVVTVAVPFSAAEQK